MKLPLTYSQLLYLQSTLKLIGEGNALIKRIDPMQLSVLAVINDLIQSHSQRPDMTHLPNRSVHTLTPDFPFANQPGLDL